MQSLKIPPSPIASRPSGPRSGRWRSTIPGLLTALVLSLPGGAWSAPEPPASPPEGSPAVSQDAAASGQPAIHFEPSLIVPGPMQVPHPADPAQEARPDEAIMFRVNVKGSGYVFLAAEDENGKLTHLYGGRPDEDAISGSQLIYDDGRVLAYALEPNKGKSVTFVAALSKTPWEKLPLTLPSTPRSWPDPSSSATPPPGAPIAWDRFTVKVASTAPTPIPEGKIVQSDSSEGGIWLLIILGLGVLGAGGVALAVSRRKRTWDDENSSR